MQNKKYQKEHSCTEKMKYVNVLEILYITRQLDTGISR